ncbi:MAG: hypothetical protein Q8M11_21280 [Sulfuritalea sp.]|nr:hypothetical protein [Sulfuritalea sp.]MDP1984658.1 hypothetical protein [Sulfuritalea sp.]
MHTQPHTQAPDIRLISIAAAAEAIGLTVKTARNKLSSGTFPICTKRVNGKRVVRSDDLASYINQVFPAFKIPEPAPQPAKRGPGAPRKLAKQSNK